MNSDDEISKSSDMKAGGIFIVFGLLIGIAIGIWTSEISLGLISGFALGVLAAIVTWLIDRKQNPGN